VPAVILFRRKTGASVPWIIVSSILVVLGVMCERYLIVIPGLEYPPEILPGMVITGTLAAEGIVTYSISFFEILQALGVLGLIGMIFVLGLKYLSFLPTEARVHEQSQMLAHMNLQDDATESTVAGNRGC